MVCENILYIFGVFHAKRACCIVNGFPRIRLELWNLGHSCVMCLMASSLSQSHNYSAIRWHNIMLLLLAKYSILEWNQLEFENDNLRLTLSEKRCVLTRVSYHYESKNRFRQSRAWLQRLLGFSTVRLVVMWQFFATNKVWCNIINNMCKLRTRGNAIWTTINNNDECEPVKKSPAVQYKTYRYKVLDISYRNSQKIWSHIKQTLESETRKSPTVF